MKNAFTIDKLKVVPPEGLKSKSMTKIDEEALEEEYEEDEEVEGGFASNVDASIKANKIFIRRTYIYFVEVSGQIKRLNLVDCKLNNPLKRAER